MDTPLSVYVLFVSVFLMSACKRYPNLEITPYPNLNWEQRSLEHWMKELSYTRLLICTPEVSLASQYKGPITVCLRVDGSRKAHQCRRVQRNIRWKCVVHSWQLLAYIYIIAVTGAFHIVINPIYWPPLILFCPPLWHVSIASRDQSRTEDKICFSTISDACLCRYRSITSISIYCSSLL